MQPQIRKPGAVVSTSDRTQYSNIYFKPFGVKSEGRR